MAKGDRSAARRSETAQKAAERRNQSDLGRRIRRDIRKAVDFHERGRFQPAVRIYRAFLADYPDNARVLNLFGDALLNIGETASATDALERSVALDPANPMAQNNLGNAYAADGRLADALARYRLAVESDPGFKVAWSNQGNVQARMGDGEAAVDSFRRAIAVDPGVAAFHFNLANTLRDLQRLDDAIACYRDALALDPHNAAAHNNLGNALRDRGDPAAAVACFRRAIEIDRGFAIAHYNLADTLKSAGDTDGAITAYRLVLEIEPDNAGAMHMLNALTGNTTPKVPDAFVRQIFDSYAPLFETHLVKMLDYRVPDAMRRAVDAARGDGCRADAVALDLGCGTGLVAEAFRGRAGTFHGVDISANMVVAAGRKRLYDRLEQGELAEFLDGCDAEIYDIILAGDVFIYVGDLDAVFRNVGRNLRDGGLFCLSIERLDGGTYRLLKSGRYAQSLDYVRGLAAANGLNVLSEDDVVVRTENGEPIDGAIVVIEKAAA